MNSVILIGNLTKDPELRHTQAGKAVCKFTVAVNDRRMNPNTGEYEDSPSYIPVVVRDRQAENCDKFLSKGRKVAVMGRIKTGSYTKQDGSKVYTTDVVANNVEFINAEPAGKTFDTSPAKPDNQYITRQQYEQEKLPPGFEQMAEQESIPF